MYVYSYTYYVILRVLQLYGIQKGSWSSYFVTPYTHRLLTTLKFALKFAHQFRGQTTFDTRISYHRICILLSLVVRSTRRFEHINTLLHEFYEYYIVLTYNIIPANKYLVYSSIQQDTRYGLVPSSVLFIKIQKCQGNQSCGHTSYSTRTILSTYLLSQNVRG